MAMCPQEDGEGQTQEPDAGLKGWGSQAGRVPRGTWDVPPEGPGHPGVMGVGSQQCGPILCSPLGLRAGRRLLGSTSQGPRKQDSQLSRRPVSATRGART